MGLRGDTKNPVGNRNIGIKHGHQHREKEATVKMVTNQAPKLEGLHSSELEEVFPTQPYRDRF